MQARELGDGIASGGAVDAILIEDVTQVFPGQGSRDETFVLDNVSLRIPPGQFMAFVGPSGCGKTTLLNIVAGIVEPSAGEVRVGGEPVTGPRRSTGYMFARAALLPWRTAAFNVAFPMEIRGIGAAERRREVSRLLAMVGLEGFEEAYPSQLSQGMRQRVALARTLAVKPSLLLLDEPFAALDAQTKLLVQQEFVRIWEENRQTVIFVTHDLQEAVALSDRVVVFSRRPGRFKADVTIDLQRPRNLVDIRLDRRFGQLYEQLWAALRDEFV